VFRGPWTSLSGGAIEHQSDSAKEQDYLIAQIIIFVKVLSIIR